MRIEAVGVRRFQSLWECDVELGDLTVIVGPSNSGKSAFGRALRTVARNAQGSNFVTHGQKAAVVTALMESGEQISIERGKGASTYRVANPVSEQEEIYAKSGTNVPEDVEKLFGMPVPEDGPDPHFTTQFDGPYLLNASGALASKTIGELTNVTLLAEAAREANRRRQEAQRLAKVRKEDSAKAAAEVREKYGNLAARKAAVEKARGHVDTALRAAGRAERLEEQAERATAAKLAVERLEEQADLNWKPDEIAARLEAAESFSRAATVREKLAKEVELRALEIEKQDETIGKIAVAIRAAEERIAAMLKEAGCCPLCLQQIA